MAAPKCGHGRAEVCDECKATSPLPNGSRVIYRDYERGTPESEIEYRTIHRPGPGWGWLQGPTCRTKEDAIRTRGQWPGQTVKVMRMRPGISY